MSALACSAKPSEGELTSLPALFGLLAVELERARAIGLGIEGAICALAVRASSINDSMVHELQQLDVVLQHLGALRDFATELARDGDPQSLVSISSALDRVTLGEVRQRLSGKPASEGGDENWELFE